MTSIGPRVRVVWSVTVFRLFYSFTVARGQVLIQGGGNLAGGGRGT